ncbi:MAG: hypothetical protein HRU76_15055 [Phycisphaeraceae bacterium]|nr:hypothetical protein [Phycisphaerales bacterium]QOJ18821.1 MAG: hypothetical protein HRU76_15055 [Phycisphaeraceae bacterium]
MFARALRFGVRFTTEFTLRAAQFGLILIAAAAFTLYIAGVLSAELVLAIGAGAAMALTWAVILFLERMSRSVAASESERRRRLLRAGLCPNCRYDIRFLVEPRCPECGQRLGTTAPIVETSR